MLEFLASDTGLMVAWLLLALGAADLLAGLWLARGGGVEEAEKLFPRFRQWLPGMLALDGIVILIGLYGLRLHGLV